MCPVCKHPVDTVVKPRKVLGAYVPHYAAGPCHNPRCSACVDRVEGEAEAPEASEVGRPESG
ncbi:hypothetical protein H9Y04_01455 [Streptomyces sp. TRM66268-LWL]|uniref:Uncharacterized protein n=1 Tax=Streptomyces polyasparticus TaxID=2767826 RepID=A0ABR7S9B8_9ACTN|nr:hypothetical protein [Streptomyces polyasparticus]